MAAPERLVGVSIENARHTWRADVLREIPATVRFISAEPLLGSLFPERCDASSYPICVYGGSYACCRALGHASLHRSEYGHGAEWDDEHVWIGRNTVGDYAAPLDLTGIDWLIAGGESGLGARPMHPEWARELRDACLGQRGWAVAVGNGPRDPLSDETAFFFKQWGEWAPVGGGVLPGDVCWSSDTGERYTATRDYICAPNESDGEWLRRVGKKAAGRLLDGRTWDEMPAVRP